MFPEIDFRILIKTSKATIMNTRKINNNIHMTRKITQTKIEILLFQKRARPLISPILLTQKTLSKPSKI